ncbi:MAG TPA: hypothetical protein VEB43_01165 [Anaeromyxobacter sp.]|nr:hypothetical protein [Anaeromyxobacter sp.]
MSTAADGTAPAQPRAAASPRVFLLSPARAGGVRIELLFSPRAQFPLARAVQGPGAELGEVFRFASGLYFRGKLAYAATFGRPPPGRSAVLVIAPGAGLVPASTVVREGDLRAYAAVPVDAADPRFRGPLQRDAAALAADVGPAGEVVLLGSVAADKYVTPLLEVFGERLLFPVDFVGRGDMSRGGLLLRAVSAGFELAYAPVAGAVRRGVRPPRLPPLPRKG